MAKRAPGSLSADPAFWERGYAVVPDLVAPSQLAFLRAGIEASQRRGLMEMVTGVVPQGAMDEYAPVAGEMLLKQIHPVISAIVGRPLLPAYAYWRIYGPGAVLRRHLDRESCEISVTLPIHAEPAIPHWPIHFQDLAGSSVALELPPGAGAIYRGAKVSHWRKAFAGQHHCQIFLHYVLADGEFAAFAFDQRAGLSIDDFGDDLP